MAPACQAPAPERGGFPAPARHEAHQGSAARGCTGLGVQPARHLQAGPAKAASSDSRESQAEVLGQVGQDQPGLATRRQMGRQPAMKPCSMRLSGHTQPAPAACRRAPATRAGCRRSDLPAPPETGRHSQPRPCRPDAQAGCSPWRKSSARASLSVATTRPRRAAPAKPPARRYRCRYRRPSGTTWAAGPWLPDRRIRRAPAQTRRSADGFAPPAPEPEPPSCAIRGRRSGPAVRAARRQTLVYRPVGLQAGVAHVGRPAQRDAMVRVEGQQQHSQRAGALRLGQAVAMEILGRSRRLWPTGAPRSMRLAMA
jgi:hypothetical protein